MESQSQLLSEVTIPEQKHNFPAVLSPAEALPPPSFPGFVGAIKEGKPRLESLLRKAGAVLFRGFPVGTATDFDKVVEAFGWEEQQYVGGGAAPRTNVVGRVFTANESPPDQKISFHHEMAMVAEFPSKQFFYCEVEPTGGGETPIVLSHLIYDRMKEEYPDFVERLEVHGLIYNRVMGEDDDPSSSIGRGWKSTFLTNDKAVAEERAAKLGMKLEWLEDGVKTIMGRLPAVKLHETRNKKVWFNTMVGAYTSWEDARNVAIKTVTFGDGKPLPGEIIHDCLEILEEESVKATSSS